MTEITYVSAGQLQADVAQALDYLRSVDWIQWTADCHLHCSDFADRHARQLLERLDTALWLLSWGKLPRPAHPRTRIIAR